MYTILEYGIFSLERKLKLKRILKSTIIIKEETAAQRLMAQTNGSI